MKKAPYPFEGAAPVFLNAENRGDQRARRIGKSDKTVSAVSENPAAKSVNPAD